MPQRLLNGPFLLWRAFRHLPALCFRLVVAIPFDDPVLRFHLGDVQVRNVQAGVVKDVVLDLLIGSLALGGRYVHVIQVDTDADIVVRALLGQRNDRLVGDQYRAIGLAPCELIMQAEPYISAK